MPKNKEKPSKDFQQSQEGPDSKRAKGGKKAPKTASELQRLKEQESSNQVQFEQDELTEKSPLIKSSANSNSKKSFLSNLKDYMVWWAYQILADVSVAIEPAYAGFLWLSIRDAVDQIFDALFDDSDESWVNPLKISMIVALTVAVIANLIRDLAAVAPTDDVDEILSNTDGWVESFAKQKGFVTLNVNETLLANGVFSDEILRKLKDEKAFDEIPSSGFLISFQNAKKAIEYKILSDKDLVERKIQYVQKNYNWPQKVLGAYLSKALAIFAWPGNYFLLAVADAISISALFNDDLLSLAISTGLTGVIGALYYDMLTRRKFEKHMIEIVVNLFQNPLKRESWTNGLVAKVFKSGFAGLEVSFSVLTNVVVRAASGGFIVHDLTGLISAKTTGDDNFAGKDMLVFLAMASIAFTTLLSRTLPSKDKLFPSQEKPVLDCLGNPILLEEKSNKKTDTEISWAKPVAVGATIGAIRGGSAAGVTWMILDSLTGLYPSALGCVSGVVGFLFLAHSINIQRHFAHLAKDSNNKTKAAHPTRLTEQQLQKLESKQLFAEIVKISGNDRPTKQRIVELINLLTVGGRQVAFVSFIFGLLTATDLPLQYIFKFSQQENAILAILIGILFGTEVSKNDYAFYLPDLQAAVSEQLTRLTLYRTEKLIEDMPSRTKEGAYSTLMFWVPKTKFNPEYLTTMYNYHADKAGLELPSGEEKEEQTVLGLLN